MFPNEKFIGEVPFLPVKHVKSPAKAGKKAPFFPVENMSRAPAAPALPQRPRCGIAEPAARPKASGHLALMLQISW
jgi:hypothetical protein